MEKNDDFLQSMSLTEACAYMVTHSAKPFKEIAADIGCPYNKLWKQLNVEEEGYRLPAASILPLIRACAKPGEVPAPLLWLNARCGYRAVPMHVEPNHNDVREEILDDLSCCQTFWQAVREKKLAPHKLLELMHAALNELQETMVQYAREVK